MKQRIGYLSGAPRVSTHPDAERGGPRSHVLGVINAFKNLGWEVKPYIVGDKISQKFVGKGSEKLISGNFFRTFAVDLIRIASSYINAQKAYKELAQEVGWVYERFGTFQAMGKPFKKHGIPWILETNAILYEEALHERKSLVLVDFARSAEIKAYQECDILVCISDVLKQRLVKQIGILEEKIIVVPNGVDTELIDPDKYTPKYIFDGFTIAFVGTLDAWQGLDLLLKAVSEVKRENKVLINLLIIGDGPMREEWENLSNELGLNSQVSFLGRLPQVKLLPFLAGSDICYLGHLDLQGGKVYRSPLKLYEYMALGKPVVSSILKDSETLIHENETGFLFEPGNQKEIKLCIQKAYEHRKKLPEMGRKARQIILANHSWTARVEEMIENIESKLNV
jgi:glycosyltransferase involved in cell wall biosynthesis